MWKYQRGRIHKIDTLEVQKKSTSGNMIEFLSSCLILRMQKSLSNASQVATAKAMPAKSKHPKMAVGDDH